MSHFANIINGIVTNVIVAEQEFIDDFSKTTEGVWVQTSYNTRGGVHLDLTTGEPDGKPQLRMNYAEIGGTYDEVKDAFIPKKPPYNSWVLNVETCLWEAPIPYPNDDKDYEWNEELLSWKDVTLEN